MANYTGSATLDDIMGSGTATPGTAGADRWSSGGGNDTFVYELATAGGADRYSGGTGTDTVEFRLTAAEWANAVTQANLIAFKAAVDARVASSVGGVLVPGTGYTPLSFGIGKSLTVLEAENVRVFADGVLVLGTAAATTVGTVREQGVDTNYNPLNPTPVATGQMPLTDDLGVPIPVGSTWSFGGINGGVGLSPDIYSKLGTNNTGFSITSQGQWTYTLDNADVDTQDLQNGVTKTMSFKAIATAPDGKSAVFQNVTITLNGTNDIQTAVVSGSDFAVSERGGVGNTQVGIDGDGASGQLALTNVDNNPALTLPGSFEATGSTTMKGLYGDLTVTRVPNQATSVGTDDLTQATWSYVLRNGDANVQALPAGKVVTDPIMLTAGLFDGANNVITVTITGTDDAATLSGGTQDTSVIESGGIQDGIPGDKLAGGTFTQTDPDSTGPFFFAPLTSTALDGGGNRVDPLSSIGKYGDFTLDVSTGVWTYVLDNSRPATQALNDKWNLFGEQPSATETLTVASSVNPGATTTITVNVFGRDDLTQDITNVYGSNGATVDEAFGGDTVADGNLARIDIDGTHGSFLLFGGPAASVPGSPLLIIGGGGAVASQTYAGQYGDFVLNGNTGVWTYTRNDGPGYLASEALTKGQFGTDVMLVRSNDFGAQESVSVTIIGKDDAPTFSGPNTGNVVEAGGPRVNTLPGVPTATGKYVVTDEDAGQSGWSTASGTVAGKYGNFVFTQASGEWTYTLDNTRTVTEQLTASQTVTDTLALTTIDGTTSSVTVTITGTNDHAIISVTPTPDLQVKEAGDVANGVLYDPNANGDLDVVDVDGAGVFNESRFRAPTPTTNNFAVLTDQVGVYGNFAFNPNTGTWTYVLNNSNAGLLDSSGNNVGTAQVNKLQALADGVTATDSMLVFSEDGSASTTITVTVTGSYDVASITNTLDPILGGAVAAEGTRRSIQNDPTTATNNFLSDPSSPYTAGGNLDPILPSTVDTYLTPAPAQLTGVYGQFSFNAANGTWVYILDNEDPDTLALLSNADGSRSAQDFLTVSNTATPTESYTIAVDVYGAFTAVDLKGFDLANLGALASPNPLFDLVPNAAPKVSATAVAPGNMTGPTGLITFIARNGDPGETLSLHAGNPLTALPNLNNWGTVTVNDGTLTTVTMPLLPSSDVNGQPVQINEVLWVWDGDKQTTGPVSASLNIGLGVGQGTFISDTINMVGAGGMASGYQGNDTINGTNFADFIDGGTGEDILNGNDGNDTIVGGDGADQMSGGNDNDVLWGGIGNDTIFGDGGDDILIGGQGRDTMAGGAGISDQYFFGSGPFNSVTEDDTIIGFVPNADKLWFNETLLTSTGYQVAALPAATSIASGNWFNSVAGVNTFTQNYAADDRFIYDSLTGQLYYDVDGNLAATPTLVATLVGAPVGLDAGDFRIDALNP